MAAETSSGVKVYVIGEDHDRMQVFLKVLEARGIPTEVWNTAGGAIVTTLPPPCGVFYCRQSPSAPGREHPHATAYAREILWWLEFHNAVLVNGSKALDTETSKSLQMMTLHAVGLNTPFTIMQQGIPQTALEASKFTTAVIVKPNHGGSGKGVQSYEGGKAAATAIRNSTPAMRAAAPDNLWCLQTLLGPYTDDETAVRSILRIEVINGRVQRDYILKITAPCKEFSLCPCDPRGAMLLDKISFMVLRNPLTIPGIDGDEEKFDTFCGKIEHAFALCDALVGSVEAVVLWDNDETAYAREYAVPHEPVLFEMNFNTNYNERAEAAADIPSGSSRLVDMLQALYQDLVDATQTPSLASASECPEWP